MVQQQGTQSQWNVVADGFWNESIQRFKYCSSNSKESKLIFGNIYFNAMMMKYNLNIYETN